MKKKGVIAATVVLGFSFFTALFFFAKFLQKRRVKHSNATFGGTDGNIDSDRQIASHVGLWTNLATAMSERLATRSRRSAMIPESMLDFDLHTSAIFDQTWLLTSETNCWDSQRLIERSFSPYELSATSVSPVQVPDQLVSEQQHGTRISLSPRYPFIHLLRQINNRSSSITKQRVRHEMSGIGRSQSLALVPMRNALRNESRQKQLRFDLRRLQDVPATRFDNTIVISPQELAALSVYLASPLVLDNTGRSMTSTPSAFGVSIDVASSTNNTYQVSLLSHRPEIAHLPAKGSGYSLLYSKYFAVGALPYAHSDRTVNAVFIEDETVEVFKARSSYILQPALSTTPQSTFLASLARSKMPVLYTTLYDSGTQPNIILDAIADLPFSGGLPALAAASIIKVTQFAASGGLPPARLMQRLECLVNKVDRHTPGLDVFGPLYEPGNLCWVSRLQRHLGTLTNGSRPQEALAGEVSRMRRYTTLLQRLMALVPDTRPSDVLYAVENATKQELELAYNNAVKAYSTAKLSGTQPACSGSALRQTRGGDYVSHTLEQYMNEVLKTKLPFSIQTIAFIARMVLVAWTFSVEVVTWEGDIAGFRLSDLDQWRGKEIIMS